MKTAAEILCATVALAQCIDGGNGYVCNRLLVVVGKQQRAKMKLVLWRLLHSCCRPGCNLVQPVSGWNKLNARHYSGTCPHTNSTLFDDQRARARDTRHIKLFVNIN